MGIETAIAASIAAAQQAAAAAAQAAVTGLSSAASAAGSATGIGSGATGAGAGAGAAGSGSALTPGIALKSGMISTQEVLKGAATSAANNAAATSAAGTGLSASQLASAAAPAASQALASKEGKAAEVKLEQPGQANLSAAAAADRERRKRAPGRASTILTSPLGLSSEAGGAGANPAAARSRVSPGVKALTGRLG